MEDESRLRRQRMVEQQIRARGIGDIRVLNAMVKVPRENFVLPVDRANALRDGPLSIGFRQTISQPYIVAYMTELLQLYGDERVLEIGTGSGYQTAVLAELCLTVFTIERVPELARASRERLTRDSGYDNIRFREGDGRSGWPEEAPFQRVIATAAPEKIPVAWLEQLADPGILVAPVGIGFQRIQRVKRLDGKDRQESLIGVSFVPCV